MSAGSACGHARRGDLFKGYIPDFNPWHNY
jgi:hypothetical protein